ncbi:hypothetical protein K1719_030693 [Acacia pycnantha]|nr:hypothetical protein K1719_030693 [Acacia pycnantha]
MIRTHVRLLGPCFKTGRRGRSQANARSAQVPRHTMMAHAASHNRGNDVLADQDRGLIGSLLVERLVGAQINQCTL